MSTATIDSDLLCEVDDFIWPWDRSIPIVLQHGMARNPAFWSRWVPRLATDWRLYRPTVRGCGGSPVPPPNFRYSPESLLTDFVRVLDHFKLERIRFIGEGNGGMIGLLLAIHHPDRVESLVLCNTPAGVLKDDKRASHTTDDLESSVPYGTKEWWLQTIAVRLDPKLSTPELVDWVATSMATTPVPVARSLHETLGAMDFWGNLASLQLPVLLLTDEGGGPRQQQSRQQQQMAAAFPNARLRKITGCAGGLYLLAPEACIREVRAFWDEPQLNS